MEFISIPFVICLVITFLLYYLRTNRTHQRVCLLVASICFIGYYHIVYLLFAIGITLLTYYTGLLLHRHLSTPRATYILWGGIVGLVGIWLAARYWSPIFPLGISFYTFQALAYLIDIYWEEEPEDDLMAFSLYMMLFMKFLSGPIERGYDLLPQLHKPHPFLYEEVVRGLLTLGGGIFMKLVIADRIAPSLDIVFADVHQSTGAQLLVATLLYPIQLYADFAGYTLMAIGLGRMFGFKLSPNFDRPFCSTSTGQLWRRWHQSLSFWVRDYVFMPLSTSLRRYGKKGIYFSLITTFVVIGVWHGAGWAFAAYGLFQGLVIIYEKMTERQHEYVQTLIGKRYYDKIMMVRTYLLFALSLLFFRLEDVYDVCYVYAHLFDGFQISIKELRLGMSDHYWIVFGIAVITLFFIEWIHARRSLISRLEELPTVLRWLCYVTFVITIFFFGAFGVENFIYIQF